MGLKTQIRKLLWRTPYHNANETRIENKRQEKELLGWTPGKCYCRHGRTGATRYINRECVGG